MYIFFNINLILIGYFASQKELEIEILIFHKN